MQTWLCCYSSLCYWKATLLLVLLLMFSDLNKVMVGQKKVSESYLETRTLCCVWALLNWTSKHHSTPQHLHCVSKHKSRRAPLAVPSEYVVSVCSVSVPHV